MSNLAPAALALVICLILWFFGAPLWFAFTVAIIVGALADITAAIRALTALLALKDRSR